MAEGNSYGIKKETKFRSHMGFDKSLVLYHGSRGGIEGAIRPASRPRCDFGAGFYMGENPEQVKGLVVEDSAPMFYSLKLRISEIPKDRILILDGMDWVYAVLSCRNKVKEFSELYIAHKIKAELSNHDLVIGPIGDDRMNEAMQQFANGALTDRGLMECLKHVKYGNQFVAKTEFACSKIEILSGHEIFGEEADAIRKYSRQKRDEGKDIVKEAVRKYRREGLFLDEIIEQERKNFNLRKEGEGYDGPPYRLGL